MDANKAEKLREISYRIAPACALCKHGKFGTDARGIVQAVFGVCTNFTYQHAKHTGPPRQLSVYALGRCPDFVLSDEATRAMGTWLEFFNV